MKSEILALLREGGDYISGQELCERFGVSRTAVWKAINQLKKEGYQIEAVPNRGYILVTENESKEPLEIYGQHEIESRMDTVWAGRPVRFYDEIGSTNIQAKIDAEEGAGEGLLIVADRQTAGRGRRGRSWSSPADKNVYFTLLLKPEYRPDIASMVTLVMAMAVAQGIHMIYGQDLSPMIKWPNDIVVNGRKVCGMLTEMNVERDYIHYVVVGVGINVGLQEFPEEIAGVAASLEELSGKKVSRALLISNILKSFESYYEAFCERENLSALVDEYNHLLVNCDREVKVLDPAGEYVGRSKGINELGELLVETNEGVKNVYAGEVSVRGIYGYV